MMHFFVLISSISHFLCQTNNLGYDTFLEVLELRGGCQRQIMAPILDYQVQA